MRLNRAGFTLVELMVVAVIVAILAAVAIPLMSANKTRAMATEAEAGCGTIRTAFRGMYAETSDYSVDLNGNAVLPSPISLPGISAGDLDGKYFVDANYVLSNLGVTTYTITATGAGDVAGVIVVLDQDGTFTKTLP